MAKVTSTVLKASGGGDPFAEPNRALRHWVILRQLCFGARTEVGSRVFALLASVIDTCRQRKHSPWRYLERAITDRRAGQPLAALPR